MNCSRGDLQLRAAGAACRRTRRPAGRARRRSRPGCAWRSRRRRPGAPRAPAAARARSARGPRGSRRARRARARRRRRAGSALRMNATLRVHGLEVVGEDRDLGARRRRRESGIATSATRPRAGRLRARHASAATARPGRRARSGCRVADLARCESDAHRQPAALGAGGDVEQRHPRARARGGRLHARAHDLRCGTSRPTVARSGSTWTRADSRERLELLVAQLALQRRDDHQVDDRRWRRARSARREPRGGCAATADARRRRGSGSRRRAP